MRYHRAVICPPHVLGCDGDMVFCHVAQLLAEIFVMSVTSRLTTDLEGDDEWVSVS